MRHAAALILAALTVQIAACAPPDAAATAPGLSRTPAQAAEAAPPLPTIVSLNPCTDAILAEVADPAQLLAISHYSHDPRATSMDLPVAMRFPATGGTVEEVLALDPDIVVAGAFLPPAARAAFNNLGIRVETFGIASSVAESLAQVRDVANVAGHGEDGERLAARIENVLTAAEPAKDQPPVRTILWQPGGIVPGDNALVSELMRRTGFTSYSAEQGMGQADYLPLERLLADPPDLVLVAGQERMQRHPSLAEMDSMHHARFDPALLYCGGPTIVRAAGRLAAIRAEMPGT
ncbi:ABC transporter substrate-binding protein [Altererythrobacter sp. SALINAS58]|uniref:ABC transporter substrate-binding protein n=1 Tax=Alteripontixanthobacter muriae TaxID=2705546 RepID=UPI0015771DA7|nr:ABC transporter substrate-binding protein [Alteripontixanthobacter muriae]NTZ42942.1 ABC transporter substrate-binding protein [Alteripontixanthobacter muriae]